ncbi:hypothetical protein Micbo1qcDRAFT_103901, partial [Microdochium bolleyi]
IGFAVAKSLARAGGWNITIFNLHNLKGQTAKHSLDEIISSSSSTSSVTSRQVDCTDYQAQGAAFRETFDRTGRLDFVFANAGIAEKGDFYQRHATENDGLQPPPPYSDSVIRICLEAACKTAYIAQHYFRQTPKRLQGDQTLVLTSSSGGIYPCGRYPLYAAAKHGVVGFLRAIAPSYYKDDGIRVNAICPGPVRTGLLSDAEWDLLPQELMTNVETVADVVMMLIEGQDSEPKGNTWIDGVKMDGVEDSQDALLWGNVIEISGEKHYYRNAPRWSDATMETNMNA